jgi:hypothetical protein
MAASLKRGEWGRAVESGTLSIYELRMPTTNDMNSRSDEFRSRAAARKFTGA